MSEYQEYTWNKEETAAHKYLYPTLIQLLNKKINKIILDIGCGNGFIANKLIKDGYNVYGIDASISGIEAARATNPDSFFIQDTNSNKLPKALNSIKFDTIISTEVIEHLYNPREYINLCRSILRKNKSGQLIISTPYHGYLKNLLLAITGKLDKHFNALRDGGHIKFWSKNTLVKLNLWKSMFIKAVYKR